MLSLLRKRAGFRTLWMASTISLVGDWLTLVAVSLLVLDRGGTPWSLALVYAAHSLPQALSTPIAGPIADRFDRRKVIFATNLAQTCVTGAMSFAAFRGWISAVQLLVLFRSTLSAMIVPAETASIPRLVEADELLPANSLVGASWSVAYVFGMALGGALATLGPSVAIALDALTFFAAACVVWTLPALRPVRSAEELSEGSLLSAPREMWSALARAFADPPLFRALSAKTPLALAGGAGWLAINLITQTRHPFLSAAISLGLVQAVRGAGTGLGPILARKLAENGFGSRHALYASCLLSWASMMLFVLAPHPAWLLVAALSWGMGVGANWVLSTVALQELAPPSMLGRLAALDELGVILGMATGALGAGRLVTSGMRIDVSMALGVAISIVAWLASLGSSALPRAIESPKKDEPRVQGPDIG